MRKKVMAVVVAVLAFSLIAASAAQLGPINTSDVGANTGVVGSCDPNNGVNVDFEMTGNVVTSAVVSGIHSNCVGLDLYIELQDGSLASLGSATASVVDNNGGGNNNTVPVGPFTADPLALENVYVAIG